MTATVLCPGPTRTDFQAAARMEDSRLFTGSHVMTAAAVAGQGYNAMRAGKSSVVTGGLDRAVAVSTRFLPRGVAARMAKMVQSGM